MKTTFFILISILFWSCSSQNSQKEVSTKSDSSDLKKIIPTIAFFNSKATTPTIIPISLKKQFRTLDTTDYSHTVFSPKGSKIAYSLLHKPEVFVYTIATQKIEQIFTRDTSSLIIDKERGGFITNLVWKNENLLLMGLGVGIGVGDDEYEIDYDVVSRKEIKTKSKEINPVYGAMFISPFKDKAEEKRFMASSKFDLQSLDNGRYIMSPKTLLYQFSYNDSLSVFWYDRQKNIHKEIIKFSDKTGSLVLENGFLLGNHWLFALYNIEKQYTYFVEYDELSGDFRIVHHISDLQGVGAELTIGKEKLFITKMKENHSALFVYDGEHLKYISNYTDVENIEYCQHTNTLAIIRKNTPNGKTIIDLVQYELEK